MAASILAVGRVTVSLRRSTGRPLYIQKLLKNLVRNQNAFGRQAQSSIIVFEHPETGPFLDRRSKPGPLGLGWPDPVRQSQTDKEAFLYGIHFFTNTACVGRFNLP